MIVATNKDKHGKIHKSKKMQEGNCQFPFKYNRKLQTESIKGKKGDWCATEIDSDKKMTKYGYCVLNDDEKNLPEKNDNQIHNNNKLEENEIFADSVTITGKKNSSKKFKEGKCVFPFKYYGKMRNECIDSKNGEWCATEIDSDVETLVDEETSDKTVEDFKEDISFEGDDSEDGDDDNKD